MNINLRRVVLIGGCCLGMAQLPVQADPLTTIESTGLDLVGKERSSRTTYDYTYQASFLNTGPAVTDLVATLSSSSAAIEVLDGTSEVGALGEGETGTSADTVVLRVDRSTAFDPSALAWAFDGTADIPPIEIESSPQELSTFPGELVNLATSLSIKPPVSGQPYTVVISQTISPESGLSVAPPFDGTQYSPTNDFSTVFNQELSASAVGEYTITTVATHSDSGTTATTTAVVQVVPDDQPELFLNAPASTNAILAPDSLTEVTFVVQAHGLAEQIIQITLDGVNNSQSVVMNDSGVDGDMAASDGTYSGILIVDTQGMAPQSCLSYQASAVTQTSTVQSPVLDLCVSTLPIGLAPSDTSPGNLVTYPPTGGSVIADEVLVGIALGTSEAAITGIAASVNGSIVGALADLGLYQIRLDQPVTGLELESIIQSLLQIPEVEYAEPNGFDQGTAVTPNDTQYGSQGELETIRADEAWTIARGSVTIAIVDSGADLTHPDLDGKIIKGTDFVDGGDPDDQHGHGTHVAGIAGAETNNSTGIAGVSWGSSLLIVRVLDQNNSGTFARTAQGIKYAADQGTRIINYSGGGTGGKAIKCAAVTYAVGKGSLVISAAGNNGNSTEFYPAACTGAIAVGNTTDSDGRASDSNFGSWVDLAAPGSGILSTVPRTGSCTHCTASGYKSLSGTSMASPMVAGAAAVLLSREALTNTQLEQRLERTAKKLPGLNLGAGRLDLFEAVFNGSFEEGNLALWDKNGTVGSFDALGPITPQHRERMGYVSTGPAGAQTAGGLSQSFTVQAGVTQFPVSFKYAFISEEYPEYVGSIYDDSLSITLVDPNGVKTQLASESINSSSFSVIGGIDFPGGDATVGWTGWKTVSMTVPISAGAGTYRIELEDAGDAIYDTVLVIDEIKFK